LLARFEATKKFSHFTASRFNATYTTKDYVWYAGLVYKKHHKILIK